MFSGIGVPELLIVLVIALIVRAVQPVEQNTRRLGFVVVDIPVDGQIFDSLYAATGVKAGPVRVGGVLHGLVRAPRKAGLELAGGGHGEQSRGKNREENLSHFTLLRVKPRPGCGTG